MKTNYQNIPGVYTIMAEYSNPKYSYDMIYHTNIALKYNQIETRQIGYIHAGSARAALDLFCYQNSYSIIEIYSDDDDKIMAHVRSTCTLNKYDGIFGDPPDGELISVDINPIIGLCELEK